MRDETPEAVVLLHGIFRTRRSMAGLARYLDHAGRQLITCQEAFGHLFRPVDFPLGIIAGNRSIDPVSSAIIGIPNDGKVSMESTKLEGMIDHIALPVAHTFMPQNREVKRQSLHFLKHKKFASA